ncbi:MAG: class III poly(R)-hydroxyalkanoic acid synthase subunit PhaE [Magnetococcales bacterium]|nr:class III poly(R)-hydroxyalkanoic acid synthase subunit PhaE [Magnetococcales bacterium]
MADQFPGSMDWTNLWGDAQRQVWSAWTDAARGSMGDPWRMKPPSNPFSPESAMLGWQDGMKNWMRMFMPQPDPTPEELAMRNLMGAGEQFLRFGNEIFKSFQKFQDGTKVGEEWTRVLSSSIEEAKKFFNPEQNAQAAQRLIEMWGIPLEAWKWAAPSQVSFPGDPLALLREQMGSPMAGSWKGQLEKMFGSPPVGFSRELQTQMQDAGPELMEYQEALQEYTTLLSKIANRSLDILHKRLLELGASDKSLDSLYKVYALWVDCGEDAFAEVATGDEYAKCNARLVNAVFKLRQRQQKMTDRMLTSLNMPTKADIEGAVKMVHELRRRVRELESKLAAQVRAPREEPRPAPAPKAAEPDDRSAMAELREQMRALTAELENIRQGRDAEEEEEPAKAAAPRKKTVASRAKGV